MNESQKLSKEIGIQSGKLSLIEIGIGSLLHTFKVPFTGYFLSLNQILVITRSYLNCLPLSDSLIKKKMVPFKVSVTVAILKSLSPAGKKLTPMFAIASQGLLYSIGLFLVPGKSIGLYLAGLLSSCWSFFQPFFIYYILFGDRLFDFLLFFEKKLKKVMYFDRHDFLLIFISYVVLKLFLSQIVIYLSLNLSEDKFEKLESKILDKGRKAPKKIKISKNQKANLLFLALKDLFNPLFIFSFICYCVFTFYLEGIHTKLIWLLLRPIAVGILLFYSIRVIVHSDNIKKYLKKNFKNFYLYIEEANKFLS